MTVEVSGSLMVRWAKPDDAPALAEIHVLGWTVGHAGILPQPMLESPSVAARAAQWKSAISAGRTGSWIYVAESPHEGILGFLSATKARSALFAPSAKIAAVYVHPKAQNNGIGRALIREVGRAMALDGIGEVRLWCLWNNVAARHFYDRLGGRVVAALVETTRGVRTILAGYSWKNASDLAL